MSSQRYLQQLRAAQRREEREAVRRQKELERAAREQSKLDALAQAALEVETYDNQIEVLLSVHRDCGAPWDWRALSCRLPPPAPIPLHAREFLARQQASLGLVPDPVDVAIQAAILADEQDHDMELRAYADQAERRREVALLGRRILTGDTTAFSEAVTALDPFEELAQHGVSVDLRGLTVDLVECHVAVHGAHVVPPEVKALTSTGRLSSRPMPRKRAHEIYQDYVCGAILRVARETFAVLPCGQILVHASVEDDSPAASPGGTKVVLSVHMLRSQLANAQWDVLDPSDFIATMDHRGDFKASRKACAFAAVQPLDASDYVPQVTREDDLVSLGQQVLGVLEQVRSIAACMINRGGGGEVRT